MSRISFHKTDVVTVGLLLCSFVFRAHGKINVINAKNNKTVDSFIDFEWEYGAGLNKIGIMGYAIKADPVNGCEPITKPPHPSNSSMRWFVLIHRYECSVELKVRLAQAANYDAAILYPYDIPEMQSFSAGTHSDLFDNDITIPAFFITETDGQIILNKYMYQSGYYLYILPEEPFNILAYIVPFVIAIGLCFLVLILFVIIKCIREHRKNRRNRLSSRHLKQLPVIKFKKGDQYDVCAICLEEYNEGNKLRVLPCSHAYHTKCIDPWLTNNRRTCPICKQKVRLNGESSDSESDSETNTPNETTPLLRSLTGRTVGRLSSNFMRNPVINSNQPDVIENSSAVGESSQSAPQERSTLEQQADPSSNQLTCVELHNPSECHTNGTYSSSAPPCSSGVLSPSPYSETVRRVVEVETPESNSSSESENSRKDMIV